MGIGMQEIIVIGIIVMLIFGPSQLPKLGRSMGQTIREFRNFGKELKNTEETVRDEIRATERDLSGRR